MSLISPLRRWPNRRHLTAVPYEIDLKRQRSYPPNRMWGKTMTEIKNCPWCGYPADIFVYGGIEDPLIALVYGIECTRCPCNIIRNCMDVAAMEGNLIEVSSEWNAYEREGESPHEEDYEVEGVPI